jgi:hypothetical protein
LKRLGIPGRTAHAGNQLHRAACHYLQKALKNRCHKAKTRFIVFLPIIKDGHNQCYSPVSVCRTSVYTKQQTNSGRLLATLPTLFSKLDVCCHAWPTTQ